MDSPQSAQLEAFLAQHEGLIRRVVRHVGGWRAEQIREDIEQNVLVALWQRLGREQSLDLTPSYVYKAALRETVRRLREERAQGMQSTELPADGPVAAGTPFQEVASRECREALEASLSVLSLERQRAVRLHLQGFEVEEIMRLCGWPYQRARNLIARGMADLRAALPEKGVA